ncbi:MAG: hypothetical protein DA329_10085 [Candidatus Nitrosocosmicus sp.]|nr:hypothetical protein [Candidatus Nitrosocosmicus sp.]
MTQLTGHLTGSQIQHIVPFPTQFPTSCSLEQLMFHFAIIPDFLMLGFVTLGLIQQMHLIGWLNRCWQIGWLNRCWQIGWLNRCWQIGWLNRCWQIGWLNRCCRCWQIGWFDYHPSFLWSNY